MDVTIGTREGFTVLGLLHCINPMTADYRAIWQEQFAPRQPEMQALAVDDGPVAVFFPIDSPEMMELITGMLVSPDTAAPDGLVARPVPGGQYAMVDCTLDYLRATWIYLYGAWHETAAVAIDFSRPCYEYYPPTAKGEAMRAVVCVPVMAK